MNSGTNGEVIRTFVNTLSSRAPRQRQRTFASTFRREPIRRFSRMLTSRKTRDVKPLIKYWSKSSTITGQNTSLAREILRKHLFTLQGGVRRPTNRSARQSNEIFMRKTRPNLNADVPLDVSVRVALIRTCMIRVTTRRPISNNTRQITRVSLRRESNRRWEKWTV